MQDFEDIPEFLRVHILDVPIRQRATKEWLNGNRHLIRSKSERKMDYSHPRSLDATGKAMLKAQRKEKAKKLLELRKRRKHKA